MERFIVSSPGFTEEYVPFGQPMPAPPEHVELNAANTGLLYASLLSRGVARAVTDGSQSDVPNEIVADVTRLATAPSVGRMALHTLRSPDAIRSGDSSATEEALKGIIDFSAREGSNGLIVVRGANFSTPIANGCEQTAIELLGIIKNPAAPKVLVTGSYGKIKEPRTDLVRDLSSRFLANFDADNTFDMAPSSTGVVSAACKKPDYLNSVGLQYSRLGSKKL